jgi:hypothetical protein
MQPARAQRIASQTIRAPCSAAQRIASQPARSTSARASHPVHRSALHRILCIASHRANATSPRAAHCIANNPRTDNQPATPGQVVTAKRNSLHPSTVTLLVFLHEAIPGVIERKARAIIQDKILVE